MENNNINEAERKKAILVGLEISKNDGTAYMTSKRAASDLQAEYELQYNFRHSMEEMESLIDACDIDVAGILTQKLPHPEAGTYLGSGKLEELAELAAALDVQYCIFEDNLSPAQLKNIQNKVKIPVWDRTTLILEIFSIRARTKEARLQVESAYLQYMLPRLSGMWQHLGRQGGGGGSRANKGVGETQLELDRRMINHRIAELRRELEQIKGTRNVQRAGRIKGGLARVALVGYTNAGKSTILNAMLKMQSDDIGDKLVFEKDMLFATLDTSIRKIEMPGNRDFLLSDTVGFIENLPHGLIKAFRSTLEEATTADLILVILDASSSHYRQHKKVTEDTLRGLGADGIPRIYVMNKADLIDEYTPAYPKVNDDNIWISAKDEKSIERLKELIVERVYANSKKMRLLLPFAKGDIVNLLHSKADVLSEEYTADGIEITAICPEAIAGMVEGFRI